jgi:peroxiredoxin
VARRLEFSKVAATGALALLSACGSNTPESSSVPVLPTGSWRAVLTLPAGELPFGLEVARENDAPVVWLINGEERTRVPEVTVNAERVVMRMPGFENVIEATLAPDSMRGELVLSRSKGATLRLPFAAQHGQAWRFFAKPANGAVSVAGRWAVTFGEGDRESTAVGEFTQTGSIVTGTFLTGTGDHRFLAGEVRGDELWLSKFDGGSAALYRAKLIDGGRELDGLYSGPTGESRLRARRDEAASLGDAESRTQMTARASALDIVFPDLDGRPVSLRDPRFTGRPIVIALAGSWCPNCQDEAAFLAPLHRRHRERGLQVVSLMFEHFGDAPRAVEAVRRFRERHGIEYDTLIAGISDKDDAASRLPQLNGVFAFPTTIFIDRTGHVRRVHTGFSGPATGVHYERMTREFETLIEQMLSEPSPAPAPAPAPALALAAAAATDAESSPTHSSRAG